MSVATVLFPPLVWLAQCAVLALDVAFKGIGGAFEVLGNVFETCGVIGECASSGVVGVFKGICNAFVGSGTALS